MMEMEREERTEVTENAFAIAIAAESILHFLPSFYIASVRFSVFFFSLSFRLLCALLFHSILPPSFLPSSTSASPTTLPHLALPSPPHPPPPRPQARHSRVRSVGESLKDGDSRHALGAKQFLISSRDGPYHYLLSSGHGGEGECCRVGVLCGSVSKV